MSDEVKNKRSYMVEIWFPIEKDQDGYPESKDWEQLLAHPTRTVDQFRIESVPFYLRGVSRGDIVCAKVVKADDGELFEFVSVVNRGGHNTYRLLLRKSREGDPERTIKELTGKGLSVEAKAGNFIAVDVPPSADQAAIDLYLVSESESGRWEMQDGYLHSVDTHQSDSPA